MSALPLIAVIDDEPAVVALVEDVLAEEGYDTMSWPTGAGAHSFIRERMPVAVLLDLRMETPDAGWHVLHALRGDAQTQAIPVILITSHTEFNSEQTAEIKALGAARLPKPFSPVALIAAIAAAIAPREATGTG